MAEAESDNIAPGHPGVGLCNRRIHEGPHAFNPGTCMGWIEEPAYARRMREVLQKIREEPHHWCTRGQVVDRGATSDGSGVLKCSCPKWRRDILIDEVLGV